MKNYLKKFLVSLLALAMVVTSISYTPATVNAAVDESDLVTLHFYYTGEGTPSLVFDSSYDLDGDDFSELYADYETYSYYGLPSYVMTAEEDHENWYSITYNQNMGAFSLVAYGGVGDSTWSSTEGDNANGNKWIIDCGRQSTEDDPSAKNNFYENFTDFTNFYFTDQITSPVATELGGNEMCVFFDTEEVGEAYYHTGYMNEDGDYDEDQYVNVTGYEAVALEIEAKENAIANVENAYWIAGANDDWTAAGIFNSNYVPEMMDESDDGVFEMKLGKITKGETARFQIYAISSMYDSFPSDGWDAKVFDAEQAYTALATGYVLLTYTAETNSYEIKLYEDKKYQNEVDITDNAVTVHYYSPNYTAPAVAFASDVTADYGTPDFAYYSGNAYAYLMESEGDNWYSFTYKQSYGLFKLVNYGGVGDSSWDDTNGDDENGNKWIADIDYDKYTQYFTDENGYTDLYFTTEFSSPIAVENGGHNLLVFYDGEYEDYSEETGETVTVTRTGKEAVLNELAVIDSIADSYGFNYWIAGCVYTDKTTSPWTKEAGIFQEAYVPTAMTENEDGTFSIKLGYTPKGQENIFQIYKVSAVNDSFPSDGWSANVFSSEVAVTSLAEGYVEITYNPEDTTYGISYYTDDTYTTEAEVIDQTVRVYIYYPGTDTLTIAFGGSKISELKSKLYSETYWGRYCYKMTKYATNWYYFDVKESYGGFQIVAAPHSETYPQDTSDNDDTTWVIDVGDYGDISTGDTDNARYNALNFTEDGSGKTWIKYNTLFDTKKAAEAYSDWDYYIAGSTSDFEVFNSDGEINAEKTNANNGIFSNFWAQVYTQNDDGTATSTSDWADKMTKNSAGTVLTYKSANKAKQFTTYTFNIYADACWFGNQVGDPGADGGISFMAVANAYIKITYTIKTGAYTIGYYTDAACTKAYSFPTVRVYYYYTGSNTDTLCVAFANPVTALKSSKYSKTYWGRTCYKMKRYGSTNWYYFDYKASYGGFQIVANPQGEVYKADGSGDVADKNGTEWLTDVGNYGDVSTTDDDSARIKAVIKAGSSTKKAWIKWNNVFTTKKKAESYTDWTYYVAGSTTAWNTSKPGFFTNYWAADYYTTTDADGNSLTYKVDTWPDVMKKTSTSGVYYVNLGKAKKGTEYSFNIYPGKDWNASRLSGIMGAKNPTFKATATGYVRLFYNANKNTYYVRYYADKKFKKLVTPTVKVKSLSVNKGNKVKLSWNNVGQGVKYKVYANGKLVKTTKKLTVTLTTKPGKTVKYTVKAVLGKTTSKLSKAIKVKAPKNTAKKKIKATKSGVSLKWKKVSTAKGYVVVRSTKSKKGFKKIATLTKASKTSYVDKKAKSGKTYYYKIYAYTKVKGVKVYSKASKTYRVKAK